MTEYKDWRKWLKSEGFPARAAHAFYYNDIKSLEEIASHTETELLRIPNFGRGTLNKTKEVLARHGYTLANKPPFCPIQRAASLHAKISSHYNAIASCRKELDELEGLT